MLFRSGSNRHVVDIDDNAQLSDLMGHVELMTGVPTSGQKLVLNGKALTSLDPAKTLKECRVTNNCKVMVLGKRFDPQGDEIYKKVQEIEQKSVEVDGRLAEVRTEVRDIDLGYLAREHHEKALKSLLKRCKAGSEELMRLLETLDAMRFEEHQSEAKMKRKSVVNKVNAALDKNEDLQQTIEDTVKQLDT